MMPSSGPAFTLSRAKPSEQIYALANAPKNGTPNSLTINEIAYTVANFSFTDVAARRRGGFQQACPRHRPQL